MSIADIFKIQALYNQNGNFNDHTEWKDAFNIANAFAETSEKHRANRENLATSDLRVAQQNANAQDGINLADWNIKKRNATEPNAINATNASYLANTATAQNNLVNQNAVAEGWKLYSQAIQNNGGRVPTTEELFNLARNNPNVNPSLLAQIAGQYQNWSGEQARMLAPINPQVASQYNVLGGITSNMLDVNGNVVDFNSDVVLGKLPTGLNPSTFVANASGVQKPTELTWQQKEDYQQEQRALNNLRGDLGKLMSMEGMIVADLDEKGNVIRKKVDRDVFNQQLANLANIYRGSPQALQALRYYSNEVARQNNWPIEQK